MSLADIWHILPGYQIAIKQPQGPEPGYQLVGDTAVISVVGPTSKFGAYGTTSTIRLRSQVREVAQDRSAAQVMFYFDSPGGQLAGNLDFARDVRQLSTIKPTFAYAADMLASAAYEVASQTGRIFGNESALVGSIGTKSVLVDSSQAAAMRGIKIIPVTSGGMKGAGIPGTPVTPEYIGYAQAIIDRMTDQFIHAVADGRNMPPSRVRELADGRLHVAADAVHLGLLDGVATLEESLEQLRSFSSSVGKVFSMYGNLPLNGSPAGLATPLQQQPLQSPQPQPQPQPQPVVSPLAPASQQHPYAQPLGQATPPPQPQPAQQQPQLQPLQQPAQPQLQPQPAQQQPQLQPLQQPAQAVPQPSQNGRPTPATIAEIEAACPGAPADFVLGQVKAGASVQQAQTAFIGQLAGTVHQMRQDQQLQQVQAEPLQFPQQPQSYAQQPAQQPQQPALTMPAHAPILPDTNPQNAQTVYAGGPVQFWRATVEGKERWYREQGFDAHSAKRQAVLDTDKENPGLREAYLSALPSKPPATPPGTVSNIRRL